MLTMLHQLLRAAVRIEKKLDELLKFVVTSQKVEQGQLPIQMQPLSNPVQGACPLCQKQVKYHRVVVPETGLYAVVRTCECEPPLNQLTTLKENEYE